MQLNKTALVTGSTSGIGLGIAAKLAESGYNLVINGFGDSNEIENIRNGLIEKYAVKVIYSPADMTDSQQIQEMISSSVTELGGIDLLVNNAGVQHVNLVEDFSKESWDKVIAINLSSVFHTISAIMPHMKEQNNGGRIINIASAHGLVASSKKAAYVAAKHGVIGLTKVVGLETAEYNITCNAICPGWVLTPLVEQQIVANAKRDEINFDEAKLELLSEKQPSKEFVHTQDIGSLVLFLCSEAASNITGTHISIDGGWTAQ